MAFETLSERLQSALKSVTRKGKLTEKDAQTVFTKNNVKLIISVPSSINSHKPPLIDVIQKIYPDKMFDRKLELFARYLVPGFISYGNEVVKLQHESLYIQQS